jgi:hypothetical protein
VTDPHQQKQPSGTAWQDIVNDYRHLTTDIDPERVPQRLNCAPDVWQILRAMCADRAATGIPMLARGMDYLLGLKVTIDTGLEAGTWQVLGPHDVVLRDSREPR